MTRLWTIIVASAISLSIMADKVVDASAKKTPAWVGGMETGYIIVGAEGASLEDAKTKAMLQVKEQVISSIAVHITSNTSYQTRETILNGTADSHESYIKSVEMQCAEIPFVKGISEAKAEDYYWQKIQKDKQTYRYMYSVKYPFGSLEVRRLVAEFEQHERDKKQAAEAAISRAKELADTDFNTMQSVEEMTAHINDIRVAMTTLQDNQQAVDICKAALAKTKSMIENLDCRAEDVTRTGCTLRMYYGDHAVRCGVMPKLTSECIMSIRCRKDDDAYNVQYDYNSGCYDDEPNYMTATLQVAGTKLVRKIRIIPE